jgi:hypothetical protein
MVDQFGNVDTQTSIQTFTDSYRYTDRLTHKQTRQIQTGRLGTYRQANLAHTDRQTTVIQTGRLGTNRQADLAQTDRQTKAHTDRQTWHIQTGRLGTNRQAD